ncbi:MAG: SDR family NAD(P)-dependent oxidoreductase [Actinomycetota bacterium]|nr:SDR family NAD(P)-dependent oxidoreductase [Actinomycetota bacterium]
MDLAGKRIIVSGCANGMGAATTRAYVNAGAHVIGMDIDDAKGVSICTEASGSGKATYLHVDVSDHDSVQSAFAEAVSSLGGLDVLANPAGVHQLAVTGDISTEDWDFVFAVNVRGTMLTNQAAHPYLKKAGGGSIINFGSISGQRPEPKAAAYSATKGAVHAWTRSAAGAWGADNIRVNAILPAMHTPMSRAAAENLSEEQMSERYWRNFHGIALGKDYGDPDRDLGPVMVFLASDASHFITGQLLPVDGGQTNVR